MFYEFNLDEEGLEFKDIYDSTVITYEDEISITGQSGWTYHSDILTALSKKGFEIYVTAYEPGMNWYVESTFRDGVEWIEYDAELYDMDTYYYNPQLPVWKEEAKYQREIVENKIRKSIEWSLLYSNYDLDSLPQEFWIKLYFADPTIDAHRMILSAYPTKR